MDIWEKILGKDIYRDIDKNWCRQLSVSAQSMMRRGVQGELFQLYKRTRRYYEGKLLKLAFEPFYRFFIEVGIQYVEKHIDISGTEIDISECLADNIMRAIGRIPTRCLIRELHTCKEKGCLKGGTKEEEYQYYEEYFLRNVSYMRSVCEKYPEMLRLILLKMGQTITEIKEITELVQKDREKIKEIVLKGRDPGKLCKVCQGSSDAHNFGKTVTQLVTDNGEKLIYKPKSLNKYEVYQEVYHWFEDETGLQSNDRRVLDLQTYGWEEYIEPISCNNEEEVKTYFFRMGVHLFICYLTGGSDVHGENVIAKGGVPELLDLETIPGNLAEEKGTSEEAVLRYFTADSVLYTGFLPAPMWGNENGEGTVSALHSFERCVTPFKLPAIRNPRSSDMEIVYIPREIYLKESLVSCAGKSVSPQTYTEDICRGFQYAYRKMICRGEQIYPCLVSLYTGESRYILRHTQQYAMYLNISFSPELMSDTLDRIYLLHILKKRAQRDERYEMMFPYELKAMLDMDIPIYYFQGTSRTLRAGDGTVYEDYFDRSALTRLKEKTDRLDEDDMFRQEMLIRMSMGYHLPETENSRYIYDRFMSLASGEHILRWRLKETERRTGVWISVRFYEKSWRFEPLGMDLYDGIPGLAVFWTILSTQAGGQRYTDICSELYEKMFFYTDEVTCKGREPHSRKTGMFIGGGSVVYGYIILYRILGREEFLKYAEKHVQIVTGQIREDESCDLLSGNAGWIIVLMKLYEMTDDEKYLTAVVEIEKILWSRRSETESGIGWECAGEKAPLAGMSHGNSGFILAYTYLLKHTHNEEYVKKIRKILAYENSLYSVQHGNWKDLRQDIYKANVWCHGGSGILLSRLQLWKLDEFYGDQNVKTDIERGLECLARWEKEDRLCLCHGLAGLYLIARACDTVPEISWKKEETARMKKRLMNTNKIQIQEFCSISLMTGIAGITVALSDAGDELIW